MGVVPSGPATAPSAKPFGAVQGAGSGRWFFLVGGASAILCALFLRTAVGEEDGIWLNAATRLRGGQVLYRDFFQFIPPLSFLLVDGWMDVFGRTLAAARLLAVLAIAGSSCFAFAACRAATSRTALSAALVLGWIAASQGTLTQVNHRWFALFFTTAAAWVVLEAARARVPDVRRALMAGLACGAAGMVTPNAGALTLLASVAALLCLRRPWRALLALGVGTAAVPFLILARTAWEGTLADAFDGVILFTLQRYSAIQYRPYGFGMDWQSYPAVLLYPACALALTLLAFTPGRAVLRDKLLLPCLAFGLVGFIGSFPRADVWHINYALPLALPLAGRCAVLLGAGWPGWAQRAARIAAACFIAPSALLFAVICLGSRYVPVTDTAAGPVQFVGWGGRPEVLSRLAALPTSDRVFFYPYTPLLPFLSGRVQVSKYDLFLPSYTTAAQYRDACLSVMRDADWVLLHRFLMTKDYLLRDYPAAPDPTPPERMRFEQALEQGFAPSWEHESYELRRRTAAAGAGLCEGGWP